MQGPGYGLPRITHKRTSEKSSNIVVPKTSVNGTLRIARLGAWFRLPKVFRKPSLNQSPNTARARMGFGTHSSARPLPLGITTLFPEVALAGATLLPGCVGGICCA
jgi:hypothetical protein